MTGEVLGLRAINRAYLARQLLLDRVQRPALDAIEHLVGLQSQAPNTAYVGLWSRLAGFDPAELAGLLTGRAAVRIALMRGTIHLVSARDCGWLRPLVAGALTRQFASNHGKRLPGVDLAEVADAGRALVDERARTFDELGRLLAERFTGRDPVALAMAVRTRVPLVQVPPRGVWGRTGPAAHTSAEAWLGRDLEPEPPLDRLVLRYLAGYGPATVMDVQAWSGLTRLGEVVERLRPGLRTFRDEGGRELYDLPDAPRPDPETPAPVRLLPEYDNLLLAHADRSRVMANEHKRTVFTVNGTILGTVLVDGFVRAIYRLPPATGTLTITPLAPLKQREVRAVTAETRRLLAFTAPDAGPHEVEFQ
jgi:hypothetical protein